MNNSPATRGWNRYLAITLTMIETESAFQTRAKLVWHRIRGWCASTYYAFSYSCLFCLIICIGDTLHFVLKCRSFNLYSILSISHELLTKEKLVILIRFGFNTDENCMNFNSLLQQKYSFSLFFNFYYSIVFPSLKMRTLGYVGKIYFL